MSFSVKNDHSMIFDVLITKYSGVVHTIQTFDSVVSQYETSLLQSSRGAIQAIFETFVSKNEIVLSSNFAYAHRLQFAAEMKLDPGIMLMIFVHMLFISQTIASVAQFQKDSKTITEKTQIMIPNILKPVLNLFLLRSVIAFAKCCLSVISPFNYML